MSKFFQFNQNNSGGSFDHDESAGIGYAVIIEAQDSENANEIAERIGLYFDGVSNERDCECCGDRWYLAHEDDGKDEPCHYDTPIKEATNKTGIFDGWWGLPIYVHYLDGRIEKYENIKDNKSNSSV